MDDSDEGDAGPIDMGAFSANAAGSFVMDNVLTFWSRRLS
jgi:hypothetical protein